MVITSVKKMPPERKQRLFSLWNESYPQVLRYNKLEDFSGWLAELKNANHLLCLDENQNLVGWLGVFDRDDKRWFAMLVDPGFRKAGTGRMLLDQAKQMEASLHGWVALNEDLKTAVGEKYVSPLEFYQKNGFSEVGQGQTVRGIRLVQVRWER